MKNISSRRPSSRQYSRMNGAINERVAIDSTKFALVSRSPRSRPSRHAGRAISSLSLFAPKDNGCPMTVENARPERRTRCVSFRFRFMRPRDDRARYMLYSTSWDSNSLKQKKISNYATLNWLKTDDKPLLSNKSVRSAISDIFGTERDLVSNNDFCEFYTLGLYTFEPCTDYYSTCLILDFHFSAPSHLVSSPKQMYSRWGLSSTLLYTHAFLWYLFLSWNLHTYIRQVLLTTVNLSPLQERRYDDNVNCFPHIISQDGPDGQGGPERTRINNYE